jgi:hypothetical protein
MRSIQAYFIQRNVLVVYVSELRNIIHLLDVGNLDAVYVGYLAALHQKYLYSNRNFELLCYFEQEDRKDKRDDDLFNIINPWNN